MTSIAISWPNTKVTKLLNITVPIIQAPMAGGATTPELIAAVSNAGGLGSLGAGYLKADELRKLIKQIRELTDKSFAVNLFIPEKYHATREQIAKAEKAIHASSFELNYTINTTDTTYAPSFDDQMAVIIDEKVPIFSYTFGLLPKSWRDKLKLLNVKLLGTATTLQEAKLLEHTGADMIVAQGTEAGGHRGTFIGQVKDALIGIHALIPSVVDHIKIPVIAAGGIMDARAILAALILGAEGVQMGTAFLTCVESGIHTHYKDALLKTTTDNTTLTRAFSGKFARGIVNQFINRMESYSDAILEYPIQNKLTSTMRREAAKANNIDFMSMWAGQAAYLCKDLPAAKLLQELQNEIKFLLK